MCPTGGSVALMYTTDDAAPEVWFRDLANQWFFIAKSFTDYFRLMVSHLGVPHWQYQISKTFFEIHQDLNLEKTFFSFEFSSLFLNKFHFLLYRYVVGS